MFFDNLLPGFSLLFYVLAKNYIGYYIENKGHNTKATNHNQKPTWKNSSKRIDQLKYNKKQT